MKLFLLLKFSPQRYPKSVCILNLEFLWKIIIKDIQRDERHLGNMNNTLTNSIQQKINSVLLKIEFIGFGGRTESSGGVEVR